MTALEQLQARKQQAGSDYTAAIEARKAAQTAENDASAALTAAKMELSDAEVWLALPKAARKRIYALTPETVAAFCADHAGGQRWVDLKLQKSKSSTWCGKTTVSYDNTAEGSGVHIISRRGREWCESLEVTNG